jgi:hypothetical protein
MGLAFAAFMLPVRIVQAVFAIIILGVLAYCTYYVSPRPYSVNN